MDFVILFYIPLTRASPTLCLDLFALNVPTCFAFRFTIFGKITPHFAHRSLPLGARGKSPISCNVLSLLFTLYSGLSPFLNLSNNSFGVKIVCYILLIVDISIKNTHSLILYLLLYNNKLIYTYKILNSLFFLFKLSI